MLATPLELAAGVAAGLCYLLGTIIVAKRLGQAGEAAALTTWILTPGVVLHGLVAYWVIVTPEGINLGIHAAALLVTWVMVAFVFLAAWRLPVTSLFVLVLPIAMLALILGMLTGPPGPARLELSSALFVHVLTSIVAYSVLFMAACQSLVLAVQERNLRAHQGIALIRLLPPLETMEALLFGMLWTGIALLTISIATGFAFLEDMFAQQVVHHTVLACAAWLTYAVLLGGRQLYGWRGTTAVRWTLLAFALLLLGYFGSKFVLEIVLQR